MPPFAARIARCLAVLALPAAFCSSPAAADALQAKLDAALAPLAPLSRTGVIYDRVLPLAHIERLDGGAAAPAIGASTWYQAYDELRRASVTPSGPEVAALRADARETARGGVIPLALIDRAYERVRESALRDGSLQLAGDRIVAVARSPLVAARAVAAAALVPRTFHGGLLRFRLDRSRLFADGSPRAIAADFGDGRGERPIDLDVPIGVSYAETGTHVVRLRLTRADGSAALASFALEVAALATPPPDDTLHVTASIPWQGVYGTGDAYVYRAPGHAHIVNPIVVIEGFDLDNSMNWDELYQLLNQQNLLESLRADGFDAVVLNFTDATVPVERNAFVVAELIQQVQSLAPQSTLALVGASMGALCSRYALAYFESHAIPHRVRSWISFDGPHAGADIPLGLQHWIRFFSGQSSDAATFLAQLNSPAAREMLIYHYTEPPSVKPDPLRSSMLANFAAIGDWPTGEHRLAIANGSGARTNQGFLPGAQVIRWEYSSLFVAITGDVWAVPDQVNGQIFNGSTRIVFSTTSEQVSVSTTLPWDGAPGGSRASFAEMDAVAAPYGDIVALHPSHCFIPTISALALTNTGDPFYDVAGDGALLAHTPFDAVYFPTDNQDHVTITLENAQVVKNEIEQSLVAAVPGPGEMPGAASLATYPNPFHAVSTVRFALASAAHVALRVYAVDGREVRTLFAGTEQPGAHVASWDGRDASGSGVAPGVYFVRLDAGGRSLTLRTVKLD